MKTAVYLFRNEFTNDEKTERKIPRIKNTPEKKEEEKTPDIDKQKQTTEEKEEKNSDIKQTPGNKEEKKTPDIKQVELSSEKEEEKTSDTEEQETLQKDKKQTPEKEEKDDEIIIKSPSREPHTTPDDIERFEPEHTEEKMEATKPEAQVDGTTTTGDVAAVVGEFPEVTEAKTLEHMTKGRVRGPTRRQKRGPSRYVRRKQEDSDVDGFFQNNVSNTDFSEVLTIEEEEEIKRKERIKEKMSSRKLPGMGTPDMLKRNKKLESSEDNAPAPENEEKTEKVTSPEKSRRPKGGMVMPGMGFGGNILAEMKLKKLSKKTQDHTDVKSPDHGKPETKKTESPFGMAMLKKRAEETASKDENDNMNNNNNNNSKNSVPLKDRLFSKLKQKPDKDAKKDIEKSEVATKVKPLVPPSKPAVSTKAKPPPLPNKPKPSLLRSGKEARTRPVSELFENKRFAAASVARTRAASVEKDENLDDNK